MRRYGRKAGLWVALLLGLAMLGGCAPVTQLQRADLIAQAPKAARVLVMPPDVQLSELTAAGLEEPRADWTAAANDHIDTQLARILAENQDLAVPFEPPMDDPEALTRYHQISKLHEVVGATVMIHQLGPSYQLPSKQGVLDWTLGQSMAPLREQYQADYALFLYLRDSYANSSRQAVMLVGAIAGISVQGGRQVGFASLVDLRSGELVWFNRLYRGVGDLRSAGAAHDSLQALLRDFPL